MIIYWIATVWLSLGMLSTGIVQLIQTQDEVQRMNELGLPFFFHTIIGIWKLLGVIAILSPGFPLIKEWAYAGFFFLITGAIVTHLSVRDDAVTYFGPALLLFLTIISWYFRPARRKLIISKRDPN
jgi:hypothetical protein